MPLLMSPREENIMGMMASERNRGTLHVDNPHLSDGFYEYRGFKSRGGSGKSGKRLIRRAIRRREEVRWVSEWC